MKTRSLFDALLLSVILATCHAEAAPAGGLKPGAKDLDTPRDFPKIASRQEWQGQAKDIREQVLVSCGLWPSPKKTPLNAHVFDRVERDGYTIEKVYLETYPGFFLGGNLYRPLGKGKGPFPAVLNPHGHWGDGRMADKPEGSIAARCISFARQGMIAFSYDMVGYNDSHFADTPAQRSFSDVHWQFATNRTDLLWNISLMGLQTWNSVRALDFLASLRDVDRKRLACTGESGGGTQTFILGSIDERLAAQAPVVMVSHTMQGGCLCENAPGLRIEHSNMEIAAVPVPRPQILVAASGDWTKDTLTVEGPAIAHIYGLFGASDKFRYVRFDYGHNYNQTSREAVYQWFGKWLLKQGDPVKEATYRKEPDRDLRVFPDGKLPPGAMTRDDFLRSLRDLHWKNWLALLPHDRTGVKKYRELMLPAWRHTMQVSWPECATDVQEGSSTRSGGFTNTQLRLSRVGSSGEILARYWVPATFAKAPARKLAILAGAESGAPAAISGDGAPEGLALGLLNRGIAVLEIEKFSTGEPTDQFANFYYVYNRTKLQERVRDLLTACAAARSLEPRAAQITLIGTGRAGLWSLLAAPGADALIADCDTLNALDEEAMLAPDLFCPGILSIGGYQGTAILAATHPLYLHNTGDNFRTQEVRETYAAAHKKSSIRVSFDKLSEGAMVNWVAGLK